jgi:hypothetical protein
MELFSKKQTHSFADTLKGITHAVNSVQDMLHVQQVANIQKFWENSSGEVVYKKVKVGDKELGVIIKIKSSPRSLHIRCNLNPKKQP